MANSKEAIEAAKKAFNEFPDLRIETLPEAWHAALTAAYAVDGDYNDGVEAAKRLIAEEFCGAFEGIGDDIISKLEKLKKVTP